jgi:hypothetical protein
VIAPADLSRLCGVWKSELMESIDPARTSTSDRRRFTQGLAGGDGGTRTRDVLLAKHALGDALTCGFVEQARQARDSRTADGLERLRGTLRRYTFGTRDKASKHARAGDHQVLLHALSDAARIPGAQVELAGDQVAGVKEPSLCAPC